MTPFSKRKRIFFYALLVFVTYFLFEVVSLGIYYLARHKLFSFSENQALRLAIIDDTSSPSPRQFGALKIGNVFEVLHPYLGFVHDPTRTPGYSEYGFPDPDFYIYSKDPSRVIIGVFGGSFAALTSVQAEEVIINTLKSSPRFSDKEIKVLTIALGGYKQPQQLLSLAYLLSLGAHFDVVVNLDGFNEVALPAVENIPKGVFPFYPRNWAVRVGELDHTMSLLRKKHDSLIEDCQDWAELFSTAPLRFSVTANVLWRAYNKILFNKIAKVDMAALSYCVPDNTNLDYTVSGPSFRYVDEDAIYDDLARMWKTASIQMKNLTSANGGTYLHFLQPNQYVKGSKPLHKEELEKAYNEDHPYKRGVVLGYPKLIELGKELRREGVNFYDLTMILTDYEQPLYIDDCCHLSKEGSDIIASVIAERIAKHFDHN